MLGSARTFGPKAVSLHHYSAVLAMLTLMMTRSKYSFFREFVMLDGEKRERERGAQRGCEIREPF